MSTRTSDTITAVAAIAAIVIIITVACATGHDDTLVKMGVGIIGGIAGFSANSLIRKN
jgi:3-dehydroquinate synthetase